MYDANSVSFVPLCTSSLSLLEGGANGIDDTAAHFAEVGAALRPGDVLAVKYVYASWLPRILPRFGALVVCSLRN